MLLSEGPTSLSATLQPLPETPVITPNTQAQLSFQTKTLPKWLIAYSINSLSAAPKNLLTWSQTLILVPILIPCQPTDPLSVSFPIQEWV